MCSTLFLVDYDYSDWFVLPLEGDEKVLPMPPLEGNEEEVKERKGLKLITLNKLLIRLSILLAQIKAGNNSYKI